MGPLLGIYGLDLKLHTYKGVAHVLSGVHLEVGRGERVALVGETGCGKSLTLRAVLGLLKGKGTSLSGRIVFEGKDILGSSQMHRLRGTRITLIPQDPAAALNPAFTVRDQIEAVIRRGHKGLSRARLYQLAWEALKEAAIPDPDRVLASYPFQLSGGLKQRVLIAMALVNRPTLVLADEPGTALDVTVQAETLRVMRALTEQRFSSVVLVTHNLGVVREFSQRVYVMYAGTIVEEGPVSQIFEHSLHPYTKALLAAVPRLTGGGLPKGLDGSIPDYTSPPPGCRFQPRCPLARAGCESPQPLRTVEGSHRVACVLYQEVPRG